MSKNSINIVFGLSTTIVTLFLLYLGVRYNSTNYYTYILGRIFPVGGFFCGVISSSGIYLSSRLTNTKPDRQIYCLILATAIITYIGALLIDYGIFSPEFELSWFSLDDFADFYQSRLSQKDLIFRKGGSKESNISLTGTLAFLMEMLYIGGFLLGAYAIFRLLKDKPYCNRCKLFYSPFLKYFINFKTKESYQKFQSKLKLAGDRPTEIISLAQNSHENIEKYKHGNLFCEIEYFGCEGCNQELVRTKTEIFKIGHWLGFSNKFSILRISKEKSLIADYNEIEWWPVASKDKVSRFWGIMDWLRFR